MKLSFSSLKQDIPASIVVFLVALPLCLGIALASGAPLLSGIVAGIIGGIVVGAMSGSQSSVSGPAAGLASVVLSSILKLGSFETFLLAVVIAGVLQTIIGLLKGGFIANYIPSNIIKGLLAAIGIILILKQIPHAVGYDADAEGEFSFLQSDGHNSISELYHMLRIFKPGAIIISLISLPVLIFWDKTPLKKISFFPASLFVVAFGIAANFMYQQFAPSLYIESSHLVSIPKVDFNHLGSLFVFPNFKEILNPAVWLVAFTIAIIASLETLLNLEAVDNIDTLKRQSPPNRELLAQGIGNIISGSIGGLPITSVIVRSSVNISAGAKTKMSAILHGFFLLISVLALSQFLNQIPLASLACILLVTGYKLAKVGLFKQMYKKGWNQFIPFIVTIGMIVFTDLLIGIVTGLFVGLIFILRSNFKNPFTMEEEKVHSSETIRLELADQVTFLNKATIKDTLWNVPDKSKVIIDATYSDFIEDDILELLKSYRDTYAPSHGIQVNIIGLREKYNFSDHIQFINVLSQQELDKLSPTEIVALLKDGNKRFVEGRWSEKYIKHQVNATAMGQYPMAAVISCFDSRTAPEMVFDCGVGDLLSLRVAGNVINKDIIGSLELACQKLGLKQIVVMGHTKCGAVKASVDQRFDNNFAHIQEKIDKAIQACGCPVDKIDTEDDEIMTKISVLNAKNSMTTLLQNSPYLKEEVDKGNIGIVATIYDITTGEVDFLN